MSKSKRQKKISNFKQITALKKEYQEISEVYRKNKEEYPMQVQRGLIRRGFPQGSLMYSDLLKQLELDLEEGKLMIDLGTMTINPTFNFQTNPRWQEIQKIKKEMQIVQLEKNISEIKKNVSEVETAIAEQNVLIEGRLKQIMEFLNEMNADVSDIKVPSYIG